MNFKNWFSEAVQVGNVQKQDAYTNIDLGDDDLRQLVQNAYQIEKQDRDALHELEIAMHGLNPEIGRRLEAHGMSKGSAAFQLATMIKFITQGVPQGLYTAPLEVRDNERAAGSAVGTAGGTAYRSGHFILVSALGRPLAEGVKYVIVNMPFSQGINVLQSKFPQVKFIPYNNVKEAFNSLAQQQQTPQQKFSMTQFLQQLGIRPDAVDTRPSKDGRYIFVRNRNTGQSINIGTNEPIETAKQKAKSLFGVV